MNTVITQISVDYLLILRILLALFWGIGLALFLQFHPTGQWLAAERTYLTVVAGVGVDLLISYNADWWTYSAVIAFSSIGIIARSLYNEHNQPDIDPKKYRVIWAIEESIALSRVAIDMLAKLLAGGELAAAHVVAISRTLDKLHRLNDTLISVRRGDYGKNGNGK